MKDNRCKSVVKRFGSKDRISHLYPKPIFDTIIEPFAGGAAYSRLHHDKNVVLYEQNPVVYKRATHDMIMSLPVEDILEIGHKISEYVSSGEGLELIMCNMYVGSSTGDKVSSWVGKSGVWSSHHRRKVAEHMHKIKHWTIKNKCGIEAIRNMVECKVEGYTYFIDPPYINNIKSKGYYYGIDYEELGKLCRVLALSNQVIVCEGPGAKWLPFEFLHDNMIGRFSRKVQERVWIGGPTE